MDDRPIDLAHTPEQQALREDFRPSHLRRAQKSNACPACCPSYGTRKIRGWERGRCGEKQVLKCNNCGYVRVIADRTHRVGERSTPTPAQQKRMDRIKRFFEERSIDGTLKDWQVTADGRGGWWIVVRTAGNAWVQSGAHIRVGNLGSFKIMSTYDLLAGKDQERQKEHYAKMLK